MQTPLNGWMRIWVVLSILWAIAMVLISFQSRIHYLNESQVVSGYKSSLDRYQSQIGELDPGWERDREFWRREKVRFEEPVRPTLLEDTFITQEYLKVWEAANPQFKKQFPNIAREPGKLREWHLGVPKTIQRYRDLIESYDIEANRIAIAEANCREYRTMSLLPLIAAIGIPFLFLGLVKLTWVVFRWIWQGFKGPTPKGESISAPVELRSLREPGPVSSPVPLSVPSSGPQTTGAQAFTSGYEYASEPWSRIWAYWIDTSLLTGLMTLVLNSFVASTRAFSGWGREQIEVFSTVFVFFIAWSVVPIGIGLYLSAFGTTPGKSLFRIRVLNLDGNRPGKREAIQRNFQVLVYGLWGSLPLIYLLGVARFAQELYKGNRPFWDRYETTAFQDRPESKQTGKMWAVAVASFLYYGAIMVLSEAIFHAYR